MSLTADPFIESVRAERDHTPRMSDDVPADGLYVVIDGSPADAQYVRPMPHACYCADGRHRDDRDREPRGVWLPKGAHPITVHTYAVVVEEKTA